MRLCERRYAGARRPSDEPDGTGGRLNGISRAHTAGRVLDGTSGPGGELHGSSDVAGGELAGTSDSSDEPERAETQSFILFVFDTRFGDRFERPSEQE